MEASATSVTSAADEIINDVIGEAVVEFMASELAEKPVGSVDCSAVHVHDYALTMLRSAASEARGLPPGEVLPIGLFLERERENKHVSQQIFNKAVFDACSIARAELHDIKVKKSGKPLTACALVRGEGIVSGVNVSRSISMWLPSQEGTAEAAELVRSWAGLQSGSALSAPEVQARAVTARGLDAIAAQFAASDEILESLCLGIAASIWDDMLLDTAQLVAAM